MSMSNQEMILRLRHLGTIPGLEWAAECGERFALVAGEAVELPKSVEQARMQVALGLNYLKHNAPEVLKQFEGRNEPAGNQSHQDHSECAVAATQSQVAVD